MRWAAGSFTEPAAQAVQEMHMQALTKSQGRALRTNALKHAALGFRAHSGWAALVVVAAPSRSPAVIVRRRIELVDLGIPRQPYHAAQKLDLKEAEEVVRRCTETARLLARRAFREVIDDLRRKGHDVVGCGILLGSGRPATTLAATLASHALIHTAEGELFRDALSHASERCDLRVTGVPERELYARGTAQLGLAVDKLRSRVTELGRPIGPPWTQDEKHAALVAWLVLGAASQR